MNPPTPPTTERVGDLATFSLPAREAGGDQDTVRRSGLIFRAGEYQPQNFAMSPQEILQLASTFSGTAPAELEHVNSQGLQTILDGHLGELKAIWPSADGTDLYGDVEVPRWLDDIWGQHGRKVSLAFDRGSKQIERIGLVLDPAVKEAALFTAYATFARKRHDTGRGQYAVQEIHDATIRHGAMCAAPSATMASRHERDTIQQAHDLMVQHGATCEALKPGQSVPGYYGFSAQKGKKMSRFDKFLAYLSGEDAATADPAADPTTAVAASPAPTPTVPAPTFATPPAAAADPEVARLKAELEASNARIGAAEAALAAEAERRVLTEAAAFADRAIAAAKLTPPEREQTIAAFAQAMRDDQKGAVTFADGTTQSRVAQLNAWIEARPAHGLLSGQPAGTPQNRPLFNQATTPGQIDAQTGQPVESGAPMTEERRKELLSLSKGGQNVLAQRNGKAAAN